MNLDVVAKSKINSLIQALSKQVKKYSENDSAERTKYVLPMQVIIFCTGFFLQQKRLFFGGFSRVKKSNQDIAHIFP